MANVQHSYSGWTEMRERHTEKALLAFLFLVLIGVALVSDASWPEQMANTVLGALIGIITGRSSLSRSMDPSGGRASDKGTSVEKVSEVHTDVVKTTKED